MDIVIFLLVGAGVIAMGVCNWRGNLATIHWYNRTKITEETARPYGRAIGLGSMMIGAGLFVAGILRFFRWDVWYIALAGICLSLSINCFSIAK